MSTENAEWSWDFRDPTIHGNNWKGMQVGQIATIAVSGQALQSCFYRFPLAREHKIGGIAEPLVV